MISLLISLTKKNIYIFILILIPCFIFSNKSFALANNFLVKDLEISEEFNLNFSKDKVIEKSIEIIDNKINIKNRIPKLWDGKAAGRIVNILLERFKNKTY